MTISAEIQAKAAEWLTSGDVACVVGYERGTHGRTRPAFIYQGEDVARLIFDKTCTHNLTTYLPQLFNDGSLMKATHKLAPDASIAIITKPCDIRAINVLIGENQVSRERLKVIGVVCEGILDGAGKRAFVECEPIYTYQRRCRSCSERVPLVYDFLIGESVSPELVQEEENLRGIQDLTTSERAKYWLAQFDRCIRCYACRQVCPLCNCPACLYERDDSLWVGMGFGVDEKRTFHLGRAFHLAGRCVGCDECERVCPMGLPISLLNRRLAQEIETMFGYRPGIKPAFSPLTSILQQEQGIP